MKRIKLAVITSHPIQYNAPMFALLARSSIIEPRIFYTWSQSRETLFDKDFGKQIIWDIPLLEGYDHEFADNISENPGPGSFRGIVCPDLNKSVEHWGAQAILVFGWNYKAHYDAMRYFRTKIPVCFRGDSTLLDEKGGLKQIARRLFLKHVYKNCRAAFYVGQNNKAYFLKHGMKAQQLFFAPHAIDNNRFSDKDGKYYQQAMKWREELNIGEDDKVVLFVGKFEPKKNPLLLLNAFKQADIAGSHLIFVGNGLLEDEMKRNAGWNIHFLPFQNQSRMPVVYHLADMLALPSQGPGETWGLVINEAMACGKAVLVSSRAGCAPDLVEHNKNGHIFEFNKLDQCTDLLKKMLANKQTMKAMGNYSIEKIREWSFENIVKSLEHNISKII
jgi:glycosyltransferase involved in cell wall biosynthesis